MKEYSQTPLYATSVNVVIGCLFKYIRSQAKIDQETVANAVGLSVSAISKIELGNLSITVEHIYLLCRAYNMQNIVFFSLLDKATEFLENNRVKIYVEKGAEVQLINKRTVAIDNKNIGTLGLASAAAISLPMLSFLGLGFVASSALVTAVGLTASSLGKKKTYEVYETYEKTSSENNYELPIMHNKQLYMLIEEFIETAKDKQYE